jgi:sterol 24-C-methyltransferase
MEGDLSRIKAIVRGEPDKDKRGNTNQTMDEYSAMFDESKGGSIEARKGNYTKMVNNFYDLVTDFYEFGWGHSFHFAPRNKWESFEASIARHEMWLAHKMQIKAGDRVLDVGCGVGGPMRTIARFTGAHIVGLNNNEYQIERAKQLNQQAGLSHQCSFLKADFMKVPQEDGIYDGIYQVEATCHAPDKVGIYKEIKRLLKPGQYFGGYEWIITDKYDSSNPEHVKVKQGIEVGNGLPDLEKPSVILAAMKEAGFEVIESHDLATTSDLPWYLALSPSISIYGFLHTGLGRWLTGRMVRALEYIKLAPVGSVKAHNMLEAAAIDLVAGGQHQIFSPMFFVLARKPLEE